MGSETANDSPSIATRTIQKVRARILPYVFVLFIIAYIDRANIAFAALTMNDELGITSQQFGLVSGIFFVGYFIFEIPSNLLLHRIGARVWIARILITWGALAALTGFVQGVHQLYAMRFLLGWAEAGYFPGILLYLTYWFPEREQARAIALLIMGAPVTIILGAPVSGLILDHVHWPGIHSWRWLLILEGLPAILCGLLTYFLLPGRPGQAKFLTTDETEWIQAELAREELQKLEQCQGSAVRALTSGRVWRLAVIYFGLMIGCYTLTFWSPQLVKSLSLRYSNSEVGLLVAIPFLTAIIGMVLASTSSDLRGERRYHVAVPAIMAGMAFLLLGTTHSPFSSLVLLSLAAIGANSSLGPFWALPNQFLTGYSAAAGIALINSLGNLGGLVGPYVVGAITSRTGNLHWGLALAGSALCLSAMLVLLLPSATRRLPQQRATSTAQY